MKYSNRKWVIVNVSDITDEMIMSSMQSSMDTLRKTNNGSKAILKWEGNTPSCFDGMKTYTHTEILTELSKSEWTSSE
tara:strand:+ start:2484 stop:2717 length:234 start_codon:yes stop_codon:yes gene_type:complete